MTASADYLKKVESALKAGNATEHTHRPALKSLVEALRKGVTATNEPQRIACGSPDFIVTTGSAPLGYIEAKDVGIDLDRSEETDQLTRYRASLRNLILTDYLEFRLYRNGDIVDTVRIGTWNKAGGLKRNLAAVPNLEALFGNFFDAEVPTIASPKELAERMARLARLLHDLIRQAFVHEAENGEFHTQHKGFQKILIADLTVDQFSDMYAQTIAYGLFAARCNHSGPGFTRAQASQELPKTNPFLRRLFNNIAGADLDDRISWAVDDLAGLLAKADVAAILTDFGRGTRQHDPVVHFYETFLAAYDPKLRELRGVYYTPEPVVGYIVRSVDAILREDFSLTQGLADSSRVKLSRPKAKGKGEETYKTHRVQILDPACGTGTFLHAVVTEIHTRFSGNAGLWPGYVKDHLLPRMYGFEILMAPYAVAHMKLGIQLKDSGYDFQSDERLRVFLTNTLEEAHEMAGLPLFTQWLAEEAAAASEIKKNVPIMVVLGNPPYSRHSVNKGTWIGQLLNDYKRSPELRKPAQAKPLSDDYVKFIRFSQWRIEQTGYGVLAFVTNRGYLDNPTFLDMRESLMQSFDDMYLLDMHGISNWKEKAPGEGKDENVFDIQQGVAIAIMVRRTTRAAKCAVRRADLWGIRTAKYDWLNANDVHSTEWKEITPTQSPWLFVEQDQELFSEYQTGWSVVDIFSPNGRPAPGIVTTQDEFAISWTKEDAIQKVERLLATKSEEEANSLFTLCSQDQWNYETAKKELADGAWRKQLVQILYRPFDARWTVWNSNVAVHRRERAFSHLLAGDNLALITARSNKTGENDHFFVSSIPSECKCGESSTQSHVFPLWLYKATGPDLLSKGNATRVANISKEFLSAVSKRLGGKIPSPLETLAYIYAVLYSPSYRCRYGDFIRRNYPRVPLTSDRKLFEKLVDFGSDLIQLHLLKTTPPVSSTYPVAGSNVVSAVKFMPSSAPGIGRIGINKTQYIDGVATAVWDFTIGGYQVAQRWLNYRKGQTLSFDDVSYYQRMLGALAETIRIQAEIDAAIPGWPLP